MTAVRYNWTRFLCPRGGEIRMDGDGYPADPRERYAQIFPTGLLSIEEALAKPCVVILGEAGIGKSDVMRTIESTLRQKHGDTAVLACDLGTFGDTSDLLQELFGSARFREWQDGAGILWLVLDSLDEAMVGVKNVVGLFECHLCHLPPDRLRICISCRTAAWPETLTEAFGAQYGEEKVGIYEVVSLLRTDVELAAREAGLDPQAFTAEVDQRDAQPLAGNPASLKLLLVSAADQRGLPGSKVELYERGLTSLCEPSRQRRDRGTAGEYTIEQLVEVAARIGAYSVLTGNAAIYTGLTGAQPSGSLRLFDLAGGREGQRASEVEVSESAIRECLHTGLFTARGPELFGFAHKSYGEFLAARYVVKSGLTSVQRENLLYVRDEDPPRLIPQLHETAAWLAGMDPQFFERILATEAEILLLSDVTGRDDASKNRLVEAVLRRIQDGSVSYDHWWGLRSFFDRFRHGALAQQLRPVIGNTSWSPLARKTAIEIAAACSIKELAVELAGLALDSSVERWLRETAARAVRRLGVPEACRMLKALAFSDAGSDPDDELRGVALQACWPEHMTARELFQALTPPRNPNLLGYYEYFLRGDDLTMEKLTPGDLPGALTWADRVEPDPFGDDVLFRLSCRIVALAWQHMAEPGVLLPLAKLLVKRYRDLMYPFGRLAPGEDAGDSSYSHIVTDRTIGSDAGRRHVLLQAMVEIAKGERDLDSLGVGQPALARVEDFAWLLERACESTGDKARLWAELARMSFDWSRSEDVELWLRVRDRSETVAQVLNMPLSVEIDSKEAREWREQHSRRQELMSRRREPKPLDPPPAERVRTVLEHCLTDRPDAFPRLLDEMMLEATPTRYELAPEDIRDTPGWQSTDAETRTKIVRAAVRYLETVPTDRRQFLRPDKSYPISDRAAPQAMVLLACEDRSALETLGPEIWRGWAWNLLVQLAGRFRGQEKVRRLICGLLHERVPDEARAAVLALVERDSAEPNGPWVINVWNEFLDETLGEQLKARLDASRYSPGAYVGVLGWLMRREVAGAFEMAEARLGDISPSGERAVELSIAIATVGLKYAPERFWARIWPLVQGDDAWGRGFVERLASPQNEPAELLARLSERECADLLVWLYREYPAENDRARVGFHAVEPEEEVRRLREGLTQSLAARGTAAACEALRHLCEVYRQNEWFREMLLRAQTARRQKGWTPPRSGDLQKLLASRDARHVAGPGDLLGVLCESLDRLVQDLHGDLPGRRELWDKVPQGGSSTWRPVEEEALSDYIARHFRRDIGDRGIVVGREVQIRRRHVARDADGEAGQKLDIRVSALRRGEDEDDTEACSVTVEVKGCWNPEVRQAMRTQLAERYLRDNRCRHGLYVVGWFACGAWDRDDRRQKAVAWGSIQDAKQELTRQAEELSNTKDSDLIKAYVLDCSLR